MGKLLTVLALLVLGAFVLLPARAQAMDLAATGTTGTSGCSMDMSGSMGGMTDMTTIQSLRDCVVHCFDTGYITSPRVETALLQLVDAAQTSASNGNTTAAANSLNAFVKLVQAQSGVSIDPMDASCLAMHAQMVIQALGG